MFTWVDRVVLREQDRAVGQVTVLYDEGVVTGFGSVACEAKLKRDVLIAGIHY
jgi:predicted GNAT superfamily acetyltransferase